MKKRSYPTVNIGSVSMLLVFIILCLVTILVLSLSSAISDHTYSQKVADRNTEYYDASNQAQGLLAQIDNILADAYQKPPADYYNDLAIAFSDIDQVQTERIFTDHIISFTQEINPSSELYVELYLYTPAEIDQQFYQVTSWRQVSTKEWKGDDTLKLPGGDSL